MKNALTILMISLLLLSCNRKGPALETVPGVEIEKYLGTWFEIARFPHSFEKDLAAVTATYSLKENGKIDVVNKGYKGGVDGELKTAKGTARIPDANVPGRLKVSFFWPFAGEYLILDLDKDNYHYALVGSSSRNYLWILCRESTLDEAILTRLKQKASDLGFDTTKLEMVPQREN